MSTNNNETGKIFEALLSVPGMSDVVKIDLKIPRKLVLLLNEVIRRGVTVKGPGESIGLPDGIVKESIPELTRISEELLQKAGLIELSEKLATLAR